MAIALRIVTIATLAALAGGCSSIRDTRGYVGDEALIQSVQAGLDNKESVSGTLGRPTFTSQFGEETWYYVTSVTRQKPFTTPKIREHTVFTIKFDANGNVRSTDRTGIEKVVYVDPDGDETPTLGKKRGFLEDLFGNIGQVGSFGSNAPSGPGPNGS
jgi:outer membrane protein assembly factor BamE (lipoprotein component of BamABCDE complex)